MTDKEKAIVMAYTDTVMLTGDKLKLYYNYVDSLFGRQLYTHELAIYADKIKELAKPDFLKLCADEDVGDFDLSVPEPKPCPMIKSCQCKTAMCNVVLPDESCYWYRWFKNRIKEVEGKL